MAIVVRQTATPTNNNNISTTSCDIIFPSPTLAGSAVFLALYYDNSSTVHTLPGSDTWTNIRLTDLYARPAFTNSSACWIAPSVAGGTTTYNIAFSVITPAFNIGGGYEITGLDPSPVIGSEFTGGQTGATYDSGTGVASSFNCIVIGYGGSGGDTGKVIDNTADTAFTLIQAPSTFNQFATAYKIVGAGTYDAKATSTAAAIVEGGWTAVVLKENPVAPSTFVGLDMTPGRGISYGRSYGVI